MARRCELTGTGVMTGNNVSHAKNRSRRRFLPNLCDVTLASEKLGRSFKLRIAAKALRSVDQRGLCRKRAKCARQRERVSRTKNCANCSTAFKSRNRQRSAEGDRIGSGWRRHRQWRPCSALRFSFESTFRKGSCYSTDQTVNKDP